MIISGLTAVYMLYSNPEEAPKSLQKSDASLITGPKIKTGCSVFGVVNVNNQFPLGTGFVVAYNETRTKAFASSKLDKFGNYILNDVPPGPLCLLIERKIGDTPNESYQKAMGAAGYNTNYQLKSLRNTKGEKKKLEPHGIEELQTLLLKSPSQAEMDKAHAIAYNPAFGDLHAVRWMVDMAFFKYGKNSDQYTFFVPAGDGNRSLKMDLQVP